MDASDDTGSYLNPRHGFCVADVRELIRDHCRFELPQKLAFEQPDLGEKGFKCELRLTQHAQPGALFSALGLQCTFGWSDRLLCVYRAPPRDIVFHISFRRSEWFFRFENGAWTLCWSALMDVDNLESVLRETGLDAFLTKADFDRVATTTSQHSDELSLLRIFVSLFERHLVQNCFAGAWSDTEHSVIPK